MRSIAGEVESWKGTEGGRGRKKGRRQEEGRRRLGAEGGEAPSRRAPRGRTGMFHLLRAVLMAPRRLVHCGPPASVAALFRNLPEQITWQRAARRGLSRGTNYL